MIMTKPKTCIRAAALAGAAIALFAAAPAAAQDSERSGWTISIGAGAQFIPKFPGSEDLGVAPLVVGSLRRQGQPLTIKAPDDSFGFGFLGSDSAVDFGPAIGLQAEREEDDVGAPVGDVGLTVEAGGFAQVRVGDNFRLRAEARRGIGGHDGWVGDLSADFVLRDGERSLFTIGPRARYADSNYHDAYFGVTPTVAVATGLPVYDPGGGFHSIGATAGVTYMVSSNWGVYGYAGYDRLIGDAADSPIVRTFGSRDQFSGGVAIIYSFNVSRLFGR